MCLWEIKSCEYTIEFYTLNSNFKTPPNSQITNHWYSSKLRPLWKRICPFILRQNYWIPASRGLIRKILSNCFFCKRQNSKSVQPQVANLPNIRLQSLLKPFPNNSVDYFGLIQAKIFCKRRRNQGTLKTYWAIFYIS